MVIRRDRILIVQHESAEGDRLAGELTGLGYSVRVTPEYSVAFVLLDQWAPHLIVLDLRLPYLGAWRFLEEHRRREGHRAPVIAHADVPDLLAPALAAGVTAFLQAPVQPVVLLKMMTLLL